jgi:hypothetical protein
MQTQREPAMFDPIAAVILPRASRTPFRGGDRARRAPATILTSPAFLALSVVARGEREIPLPRLDRLTAGKARLMALAEERRTARLPLTVSTASI